MLRTERERGLEKGELSYFSRGGFFGHLTSEFKRLTPERRKMYEDAAEIDQRRFDTEFKAIVGEVLTFKQSDQVGDAFMAKVRKCGLTAM